MIPIGSTQKPLLEYIVRLLIHHGVRHVTFLVGYKHEQIVNYFGDGDRFGAICDYVRDDAELEGSGWSLVNAYTQGAVGDDESAREKIYQAPHESVNDLSQPARCAH